MKLLINTDLTVAEIAYKTGFSDQSYMTRCFKSALKITPHRISPLGDRGSVTDDACGELTKP